LFCGSCAKLHHEAPPDTGEVLDLESHPTYPPKLLQFTGMTQVMDFDPKAAAMPPGDRE